MSSADTLARLTFPFTEEQELIAEMTRGFAAEHIAPGAAQRDREHAYPTQQMRQVGELGLMGVKVSEDVGGAASDNVAYVLALASIAEADSSVAVTMAASNMAACIIDEHASDEQRRAWLQPYCEGRAGPISYALSEPHCGSDAAALTTTARADGDEYVLDGAKMWITSGAQASLHVVFARTDAGRGAKGISCFAVAPDVAGLEVGKAEEKMGQCASSTVALHFDSCRIPAANLLGERGMGLRQAFGALEAGRVGIAGVCLGMAEAAMDEGLRYVAEREAFGRPIAKFQNTRFVLANCRMQLDAAWLLTLRAAKLLDDKRPARMESSMAKVFASEALARIVDDVLQLHGGFGYSSEYTIERLYRDARVTRIYEGSSEIQRVVIARELLG